VVWQRRCVILTGLLERSDFAYWLLNGGGLRIAVHDRDRTLDDIHKREEGGGNSDFSDYNAVGEACSCCWCCRQGGTLRGLANTPAPAIVGRKLAEADNYYSSWDPYGIATIDLAALVKGARRLKVMAPILPCEERGVPPATAQIAGNGSDDPANGTGRFPSPESAAGGGCRADRLCCQRTAGRGCHAARPLCCCRYAPVSR
jgi:hypothetical protein